MSKSDKAFCLILAIIIGGCVSDKAVSKWHNIKIEEIRLERDKLFIVENEVK